MKKILIVNNNLDSGGIQKALVNLLQATAERYEITLLLFSKSGAMLAEVPPQVRVITPGELYKMLGLSRAALRQYPHLYLLKAVLKVAAKLLGKRQAMRICGLLQKPLSGYDVIISYSHMTAYDNFDNGCAEFVLDRVEGGQKMCFIHCDYGASGFASAVNNEAYREFDRIVCVSESVRRRFLEQIPDLAAKTVALRNFHDLTISNKAKAFMVEMEPEKIHLVMVARLSPEKGIGRAMEALAACGRKDLTLHIVGDGPERAVLEAKREGLGLTDRVHFYGEQKNPYPYMAAADYLLMASLHEAAPMVFDEAHELGLPILSVELLSTGEMLEDGDIQCENTVEGLTDTLKRIRRPRKYTHGEDINVHILTMFSKLIDGEVIC